MEKFKVAGGYRGVLVQWQRRYTWHQSIYVIFSLIPYLQILLISNLPGAELATLGNLIYKHYKNKKLVNNV